MAVTESKKAIVAQMKETLSEAKGAVLIGYSGLTVAQATDLRRKMLAEGVEYLSLIHILNFFHPTNSLATKYLSL